MNETDLNQKIADEVIGFAAAQHAERIALSLSEEGMEKHAFSREFERKMGALLAGERRQESYRSLRKWGLRACIFIVALIAVAAVTVYSVDALRIPVVNFFSEIGEKSALVTAAPQEISYEDVSDQIHGFTLPAYIPEGYTPQRIDGSAETYSVTYIKDNDYDKPLRVKKFGQGFSAGVDTEGAECTEPVVNGEPAFLVVKKGNPVILIFKYNNMAFRIMAYIDKSELIKMAESMKYFK